MKKGNVEINESGLRKYGIDFLSDQLGHFDVKDLKDLHSLLSELLDTLTVKELEHTVGSHFECKACIQAHILSHTVKEECEHKKFTLSVSTRNGTRKICNNCGKDSIKKEPTTPDMKPNPRERIQAIATELGHSFIRNGQFGRTVHSQAIELYLQEQYEESIKHSCVKL